MTEHHGENPMETETEWSTVNNNRSKRDNQDPIATTMNEKSTTNEAVEVEIESIRALPPKHEKTVLTRINFTILPSKGITAISIPHSMNRLIQVIQTVDPKARLISVDSKGIERQFDGSKKLPKDPKVVQEIAGRYLNGLELTKKNALVGMMILRSETDFMTIMKSNMVKQQLNQAPIIFLKQNKLNTITPALVGSFTNVSPRAGQPEIFETRIKEITDAANNCPKYQLEYSPVNAGAKCKCTMIKVFTDQENKEEMRTILKEASNKLQLDEFIAETEFYSLTMAERQKIVYRQIEYANKYRTIFIKGFNNIDCNLKDHTDNDPTTVAQWLLNQPTSNGDRMFTRIYAPVANVTELLVKQENHKEALDWARLAISETVGQAENANMKEIFTDPEDVQQQFYNFEIT